LVPRRAVNRANDAGARIMCEKFCRFLPGLDP
jgi:hypothetical protein